MRHLILLLVMCCFLVLSGCASHNDKEMQKEHEQTVRTYSAHQAAKVTNQANAIAMASDIQCPEEASTMECFLGKVLVSGEAARAIASLDTNDYKGKRPTTSLDTQKSFFENILKMTPFIAMGYVSEKAIDKDKGKTDIDAGGDVNYEHREERATAVTKDGSPAATNQPEQDNSQETTTNTSHEGE